MESRGLNQIEENDETEFKDFQIIKIRTNLLDRKQLHLLTLSNFNKKIEK